MVNYLPTWQRRMLLAITILGFAVVLLGAYARLVDGGLGCPDWPGCFGNWRVPAYSEELNKAMLLFAGIGFEESKAWAEMIHRYAAFCLGIMVITISFYNIFNYKSTSLNFTLTNIALLCLILFQAALGMWTVTMKLLPLVVMSHLIGGMTITVIVWWLYSYYQRLERIDITAAVRNKYLKYTIIAIIITYMQIILGGWTTANYASLICPDFPFCQGELMPAMNFSSAFNLFKPIGVNYQGGALTTAARTAIHITHRVGAIITFTYLLTFATILSTNCRDRSVQSLSIALLLLIFLQVAFGIANVFSKAQVFIALVHNGLALSLLLVLTTILSRLLYGYSSIK